MASIELTEDFFLPVVPAWASPEEEDWARWRGKRLLELHAPYGWLALASYEVLPAEPSQLASVPGQWWAADGTAHVRASGGVLRDLEGSPISELSLTLEEGESAIIGQFEAAARPFHSAFREGARRTVDTGAVRIEVGVRGGHWMLRTRLPEPELAQVPSYPFSPSWAVSAIFEPSIRPYREGIRSAREDTFLETEIVGTVTFRIPGHPDEVTAAVTDSGPGESGQHCLTLAFHDKTNGKSTAAWRFATVVVRGVPGPDGWAAGHYNCVIDFNRALNYPMAFSSFAVCPAPVLGNRIDAPVTAGEKALLRGHADGTVQADDLAVQQRILRDVTDQLGKL